MLHAARLMLAALYAAAEDRDAEADTQLVLESPYSTVSRADWAMSVQAWLEDGAPLLAHQPARECPACGAALNRPLFASYDGYPFSECLVCGCWYVPKRVDRTLFEQFFERRPEAREIARRGLNKRASPENLALDLNRIGAYLDTLRSARLPSCARMRYLDIGTGTGSSLVAALERGMEAVGVEIDDQAAELARARGVEVRDSSQGLPDGPFELVSLWESLEHICDPLDMLTSAADRLAPSGLLAVTVPNLDAPMARIMRGDCMFLGGGSDGPGHINLFGVPQLRRLFERAGLELIEVDAQYNTNLLELAGYLLGRHRGASSLLGGDPVRYGLPSALARMLNAGGPAISLLERHAHLSPILFAIAGRTADAEQLAPVAARIAEHRKAALAAQADTLSRSLPDYAAQMRALQGEVNLRDEMLQRLQASANELQALVGRLQSEVNLRDGMLERLQARLNRLGGNRP